MRKHGFYTTEGNWVEEPCNAYCRGDHHAMIAYTGVDDTLAWVAGAVERRNRNLRIVSVYREPAAPPCPPERYVVDADVAPVVLVFATRP